MQSHLDDNYISVGALNFYSRATLPQQCAQYSNNYVPNTDIPLDVVALYKQEVMDIPLMERTWDMADLSDCQCAQSPNSLCFPKYWEGKCDQRLK